MKIANDRIIKSLRITAISISAAVAILSACADKETSSPFVPSTYPDPSYQSSSTDSNPNSDDSGDQATDDAFTSDNPVDGSMRYSLQQFNNCQAILPVAAEEEGWARVGIDNQNGTLGGVETPDERTLIAYFSQGMATDYPGTYIGDMALAKAEVDGFPAGVVSMDPVEAAVSWASVFARDTTGDPNLVADMSTYTEDPNGWAMLRVESSDLKGYLIGTAIPVDVPTYAYILIVHVALVGAEASEDELQQAVRMAISMQCNHRLRPVDFTSYRSSDGVSFDSTDGSDDGDGEEYEWVLGSEFLDDPNHPGEKIWATIDQEVSNACNTGVSGVEIVGPNGCSVATFNGE